MLLFASAGVLEHSGIKIPYFAFFSHDSGKRPQEAPFNMLLAMGMAAALCILIGVSPGWLYQFLPYQEVGDGLPGAPNCGRSAHVLQQLQLLVFAALAFMLLQWRQLYPAEQPGRDHRCRMDLAARLADAGARWLARPMRQGRAGRVGAGWRALAAWCRWRPGRSSRRVDGSRPRFR